jgi:hypothetical protein
MTDFSTDIYNFEQYGTYTYKYDGTGNIVFNISSSDFSRVYISFPLENFLYNNDKINKFYNIQFEEFIPASGSIEPQPDIGNLESQIVSITQENITLRSQLDSIIAINETSGSEADTMAIKEVILELRKALGQGRVDSDFIEDFPYTPLRKVAV